MWKRWLVLSGPFVFAFLLVGLAALTDSSDNSIINPESYALIQEGMSEAQVEALLGGPAHASEPLKALDPATGQTRATGAVIRVWNGRDGSILLVVGKEKTVSNVVCHASEGLRGRVFRRLGI